MCMAPRQARHSARWRITRPGSSWALSPWVSPPTRSPRAPEGGQRRGMGWRIVQADAFASRPVSGNPPGLAAALRVGTRWVGRSKFDYLVEVDSEDVVRGLKPDLAALERVDARGIIVTSRAATPGFDFVSRFFAPQSGVPEDPVTGSAHCALAPYWSERLHRAELTGYQASPRGGVVRVRLAGDRVMLGGQAVTVLRGELLS